MKELSWKEKIESEFKLLTDEKRANDIQNGSNCEFRRIFNNIDFSAYSMYRYIADNGFFLPVCKIRLQQSINKKDRQHCFFRPLTNGIDKVEHYAIVPIEVIERSKIPQAINTLVKCNVFECIYEKYYSDIKYYIKFQEDEYLKSWIIDKMPFGFDKYPQEICPIRGALNPTLIGKMFYRMYIENVIQEVKNQNEQR